MLLPKASALVCTLRGKCFLCNTYFLLLLICGALRNFAASQTQCVQGAVFQRYRSKADAVAAYNTAKDQGVVEFL